MATEPKNLMSKRKNFFDNSATEPKLKLAKTEHFEQQTRPDMSVKLNPQDLKNAKNYECFKNELLLWQTLTTLEESKQAGCKPAK